MELYNDRRRNCRVIVGAKMDKGPIYWTQSDPSSPTHYVIDPTQQYKNFQDPTQPDGKR